MACAASPTNTTFPFEELQLSRGSWKKTPISKNRSHRKQRRKTSAGMFAFIILLCAYSFVTDELARQDGLLLALPNGSFEQKAKLCLFLFSPTGEH